MARYYLSIQSIDFIHTEELCDRQAVISQCLNQIYADGIINNC